MPIVAGNTLISSSTVQGVALLIVFVGSGSFSRLIKPSVTWKMCPLTCCDSSDANHVTKGATSLASPLSSEPAMMPLSDLNSRASLGTLVVIRVEALGAIALAVTP